MPGAEEDDESGDLTLEERRRLWSDGYKFWQESVIRRIVEKHGEELVDSCPKILPWEEFKNDIEHNGGKVVMEWDYSMAEGAV